MPQTFVTFAIFVMGLLALGRAVHEPANAEIISIDDKPESIATEDPAVWLNGKPVGTVQDLGKLGIELKSIIDKWGDNYRPRLEPESNKIEDLIELNASRNTVYVLIDPSVDLESVLRVSKTIEDNGGKFRIPKASALKTSNLGVKPDPFLLTVSIGGRRFDNGVLRLPAVDPKMRISHALNIAKLATGSEITVARLFGNIEIPANGDYLANEQQWRYKETDAGRILTDRNGKEIDLDKPTHTFVPTMRPMDKTKVESDISKLFEFRDKDGRLRIYVSVDKRATFASLAPLFAMDADKYVFQINLIGV